MENSTSMEPQEKSRILSIEPLIFDKVEIEKLCQTLRTGVENIQLILNFLSEAPIGAQLNTKLRQAHTSMFVYSIFKSDCHWKEYDPELKEIYNSILTTYNEFTMTERVYDYHDGLGYKVRILVDVINTLENVKTRLNKKISEYECAVSVGYDEKSA